MRKDEGGGGGVRFLPGWPIAIRANEEEEGGDFPRRLRIFLSGVGAVGGKSAPGDDDPAAAEPPLPGTFAADSRDRASPGFGAASDDWGRRR